MQNREILLLQRKQLQFCIHWQINFPKEWNYRKLRGGVDDATGADDF